MIPLADRSYDVVIDTPGGKTLERAFLVLRRGGRLVTLSATTVSFGADVVATLSQLGANPRSYAETG